MYICNHLYIRDYSMHTPVLLNEVLNLLNPRPGQTFIDATVNGGGHAREIARHLGPQGRVIGMDWDCDIIRESGIRNRESGITNIELVCDTYLHMAQVMQERGIEKADGILFDLGFSSYHVDRGARGFSFAKDEPLDMRYRPEPGRMTASDIVNRYSERELADIFTRYGEDRFARRMARGIAAERRKKKILTSRHLADVVRHSVPRPARYGGVHPATRAFQALRIAVNDELGSVAAVLPAAVSLLAAGGTIAVVAFHSLEDRIVKTFMREEEKKGTMRMLTAKPIRPSGAEIHANPRSRSARLRAAIKI